MDAIRRGRYCAQFPDGDKPAIAIGHAEHCVVVRQRISPIPRIKRISTSDCRRKPGPEGGDGNPCCEPVDVCFHVSFRTVIPIARLCLYVPTVRRAINLSEKMKKFCELSVASGPLFGVRQFFE